MEKGKEARERTDIGNIRDEVGLVLVNHKLSDATLEQDLKDQFGESAVTKSAKANDIYYIERNGHTFTVYDDGNGEVVEGAVSVWDGETEVPEFKQENNVYRVLLSTFMKNIELLDKISEEKKY